MEYPVTTNYHWPKFNEKATTGKNEGFEEVQGPFQFGLAVKVDKSKQQVFFYIPQTCMSFVLRKI